MTKQTKMSSGRGPVLDTKRLADTLVSGAKAYIDKALACITSRIDALEKRQPEKGEKGDRGERGDAGKDGQNGVGLAAALIDKNGELVVTLSDGGVQKLGVVVGAEGKLGEKGERGEKGEAGERGADGADGRHGADGKDGKDADPEFIRQLVADAVAEIPAPKDGKDVDMDAVRAMIDDAVAKAVAAVPAPKDGRDGKDGKDAEPVTVGQIVDAVRSAPDAVKAAVVEYLTANPPPAGKDGKDGEKGDPGKDGKDGSDGRDGKDGVDAVEFFKSDAGHLIVTMSNGATRDLGPIVGKDGAPGRDGFSLKDFDAELMPDGRSILLKFADETDTSFAVELGIPTMIYRGAYKHDQTYSKGDTVTWNGSLWHCNVDGNGDRPGERDSGWSLAAKAGRDGKDYSPQEPKAHEPVRLK